jgi:hypothetical protein
MHRTSRSRVSAFRARLRKAGLRPVQIWVPDARKAGFADECRRQSRSLLGDRQETEIVEWLDQVADRDDWRDD